MPKKFQIFQILFQQNSTQIIQITLAKRLITNFFLWTTQIKSALKKAINWRLFPENKINSKSFPLTLGGRIVSTAESFLAPSPPNLHAYTCKKQMHWPIKLQVTGRRSTQTRWANDRNSLFLFKKSFSLIFLPKTRPKSFEFLKIYTI